MKEIETLWHETRDLSLGTTIQCLHSPPTPLHFLHHFVLPNKPCIISNSISHWPALFLWSQPHHPHLRRLLNNSLVSLHLTPHGRADSPLPSPSCFASAHVAPTPFPRALDLILSSKAGRHVAYLQQQNDCFRTEYSELSSDVDADIPWATEAFGVGPPEAVNLWIGNELSETSFHKDHYENLYAVVSGQKHFLLIPPTEVHRLYVEDYPAAKYCYSEESGEFRLEMEEPMRYVPWCSVNPYPSPEMKESEIAKFPLYFNGPKPFECTVNAGEILYLPSMWFHYVRQIPDESRCTIAVNYWYDMQFDIKYAYFNFLQSIRYREKLTISEHEDLCSDVSKGKNNVGDKLCNGASAVDASQDNKDN